MQAQLLSLIATRLIDGYLDNFLWKDIWTRPLEDGSAFEWTMLAALAAQAEIRGWKYSFPILNLPMGASLFPLRNEIPKHHGAQPGHSGTRQGHNLKDRFLQAFIPKILLSKNDQYYSMFREGCSYHQVMANVDYQERPDILILPGHPQETFPKLTQQDTCLDFSFKLSEHTSISGQVRVLNSPVVRCRYRIPEEGLQLPIAGIMECSVNKSLSIANAQLEGYIRIFSTSSASPPVFLVTGNEIPPCKWLKATIPLSCTDENLLEYAFRRAANLALDAFGIA
ncbi:hypothetical protein [Nostoc sp. FACHB-888]|uniref:hypothetical protein n=1 Tax=Nostoc sp. FACHB-888 TaxID=2692842 RepID=UPI001684F2F8|nr:hypothetical protein [Nostoc sp. FACHB-888]MBD2247051.1 hypothetical protein [Nostoc sp. FACHB-888]